VRELFRNRWIKKSQKFISYDLTPDQPLIVNKVYSIDPKNKYEFSIDAICSKGDKKAAFITMIFLDEKRKEIHRRVKFISDSLGVQKTYSIISSIPLGSSFVSLGYRINTELAEPSHIKIKFSQIMEPVIVKKTTKENYDIVYNYKDYWKGKNLEENFWTPVGHYNNVDEYYASGKTHFNILKIAGLKPEHNILDIGCGTGIWMDLLKPFLSDTRNYVGVDISEEAINFCKKKFPDFEFHVCSNTQLPPLSKKFDVICLFSVFTHLYPNEILDYLKNMKNYLKPSGFVFADILKNSSVYEYSGTPDRMEYNEKFFIEILKSAGYSSHESVIKGSPDAQIPYKIFP